MDTASTYNNFNNNIFSRNNPIESHSRSSSANKKRTLKALKVLAVALAILFSLSVTLLTAKFSIITATITVIFGLISLSSFIALKALTKKWSTSTDYEINNYNNVASHNGFQVNNQNSWLFNNDRETSTSDTCNLTVELDLIKTAPTVVLSELSDKIYSNTNRIVVKFNGKNERQMRGIDAGGLSKQLIGDLFEELLTQKNLLPEKSKNISREQKEIWKDVGRLMMFCYKSRNEYPIGLIFKEDFYNALLQLSNEEVTSSLSNFINYNNNAKLNRLIELYRILQSDDSSSIQCLNHITKPLKPAQELSNEERREAFDSLLLDEDVPDDLVIIEQVCDDNQPDQVNLEKLKDNFHLIQTRIKNEALKPELDQHLTRLHCIAQGMHYLSKNSWNSMRYSTSKALHEKIEGKLTGSYIYQKFGSSYLISQRTKNFLSRWLDEADHKNLKNITKAITGSQSLGVSSQLYISSLDAYRYSHCYFHTCSNQIDIPNKYFSSYEDFKTMLDESIANSLELPFDRA